jgi:serine/threonine-protein kinase
MSPEQAESVLMRKSAPINARADIYSLGVVFFEMLTGFVPFRAKGMDLVRAHVDAPIPTLDHFMDEVPDGAQEIINRALAKSPNDRYPTAQAFAKDVKEMASGRWFLRSLF